MPVLLDPDAIGNDEFEESEEEASGSREVVLQQSVTMLAYMERTSFNATVAPGLGHPRMLLGLSLGDLTILMGAAIGAAGLLIVILTTLVVWQCCQYRRRPDKGYCLDNSTPDENSLKPSDGTMLHSDSVVFLGTKVNQVSTCAINIPKDFCQSILTRSQSVPLKEGKELPRLPYVSRPFSKKRPTSQPVQSAHPYRHLDRRLPCIPEMAFRTADIACDRQYPNLYASCNALDGRPHPSATMKTRSLPLWGRTKPRSVDDAKVSFSKRRKNRMRSDSAAAIAVNKSHHKDTDSLVDNEAVVVYDERTAL